MDLLTDSPPRHFFCVSTDKAANPVSFFKVTMARFANVAFSNGSLPDGWIHRLQATRQAEAA